MDAELGVVLGGVFDELAEDGLVVVSDQNHFADVGDLGDGLQTVTENGVTGDFEERLFIVSFVSGPMCTYASRGGGATDLGHVERQGPKPGSSRRTSDLSDIQSVFEQL